MTRRTKKLLMTLAILAFTACASLNTSKEELKSSGQCMVWKEDILGMRHATPVEGEFARQKMKCWLMDLFLCSYINYTYRDGTNEILSDLPPKDKTIATLSGKKMTIDMTGITVEPFNIEKDHATYTYQGVIGPKQTGTVEFNEKCSTRQVALGLLTVIAK